MVISGLPYKSCNQLVCGLQFVEQQQQFTWIVLILWTLIGSKLMQTTGRRVIHIWRQKLCVKLNGGKITRARCKNSRNMSIFNHSMFLFCFIYLLPRRKRIESFHFQPFSPQNLSFPAFSIYGQSLEYELITGDHRTNQIAWNRITSGLYLIKYSNYIQEQFMCTGLRICKTTNLIVPLTFQLTTAASRNFQSATSNT